MNGAREGEEMRGRSSFTRASGGGGKLRHRSSTNTTDLALSDPTPLPSSTRNNDDLRAQTTTRCVTTGAMEGHAYRGGRVELRAGHAGAAVLRAHRGDGEQRQHPVLRAAVVHRLRGELPAALPRRPGNRGGAGHKWLNPVVTRSACKRLVYKLNAVGPIA
jgi:hypothetical protein